MARSREERTSPAASSADRWLRPGPGRALALFAGAVVLLLLIYGPALNGEFISDDWHYVQDNPYVHELSLANIGAILSPTSIVVDMVENYAPVHLLLHALEWQVFGERVFGYHVVNLMFHALAALLLMLLLRRTGVPDLAAAAGALFFLVHPGNVEAVAWISQLKTTSSMVLALGAVLAHPRRPLLGTALFVLALLAKPQGAVALPMAALLVWTERSSAGADAPPARWGWLGVWALAFVAFAVVELGAFGRSPALIAPLYEDPGERLRSSFAIGLRYLVMAASSCGLSAFHEPAAARSLLDPWWVGALVAFGLLTWRLALTLARRRAEAAWWLWAAVSFAPISGVIPLPYPLADRYLYFILPGLIGASLLAGRDVVAALAPRWQARGLPSAVHLRTAALVASAALALGFAVRAHERAGVWRTWQFVMVDSERHYPEGAPAQILKARRAARIGDVDAALEALRVAHARGYGRIDHLMADPDYIALHGDPRFQALMREWAAEWLERIRGGESQAILRTIAQLELWLGNEQAALRAAERALAVGGPADAELAREIEMLRGLPGNRARAR